MRVREASVRDPFGDLYALVLALWRDALFAKLLAMVIAASTGFALFTDAEWETVIGMIGLGCLAAMLEVTLRSRF